VTVVSQGDRVPPELERPDTDEAWIEALGSSGPRQAEALRRLHDLMLRAARHQVRRMGSILANSGVDGVEELANQAADEAMVALLAKLGTFERRSRFTTWAYKFAILQASTEVRRRAWRQREVNLEDLDTVADHGSSPEQHAEAADLAAALRSAMNVALTPYQRRIALALLLDGVPIDVLSERLGTTRGALYKTLHDVRVRLRAELAAAGHLVDTTRQAGTP
jgi:RNA polymerase sigma-70 factor (ECF subfamily)